MRTLSKIAIGSLLLISSIAFAGGESEHQDKMQEELDSWKPRLISSCGNSDKMTAKWHGKLGTNPRAVAEGEANSLLDLCRSAMDATGFTCANNRVVKQTIGKVTAVVCQRGTGTIGYSLKGTTLTFTVDGKFSKKNTNEQEEALTEKLKTDLDK